MDYNRTLWDIIEPFDCESLKSKITKESVYDILSVAIDYERYNVVELCNEFLASDDGVPTMEEFSLLPYGGYVSGGRYVWDVMYIVSKSYEKEEARFRLTESTQKFFESFSKYLAMDASNDNNQGGPSLHDIFTLIFAMNAPMRRILAMNILMDMSTSRRREGGGGIERGVEGEQPVSNSNIVNISYNSYKQDHFTNCEYQVLSILLSMYSYHEAIFTKEDIAMMINNRQLKYIIHDKVNSLCNINNNSGSQVIMDDEDDETLDEDNNKNHHHHHHKKKNSTNEYWVNFVCEKICLVVVSP